MNEWMNMIYLGGGEEGYDRLQKLENLLGKCKLNKMLIDKGGEKTFGRGQRGGCSRASGERGYFSW